MQKIIKKKIIWLLMVVFLSAPFITNAALTITTNAATSVTNTSATLNATVAIFQQNANVKFRYTLTNPGTSQTCSNLTNYIETSNQSYNYSGSSNGGTFSLSRNIAGLIQGTTYYFCALDQGNGVYGNVLNFTTTGTTPSGGGGGSNASLSSSGVTQTGATLIATNITSPAGPNGPAESVYFRYTSGSSNSCSGMTNYQSSSSASAGPTNNWQVSIPVSGLSANTTYRFCLVITPNANVGNQFLYSDIVTFQTPPNPSGGGGTNACGSSGNPTIGNVGTHPALNITDTQATLRGSVANLSCTVYGYFRYSSLAIPPVFCNDIFSSSMRSVTATVPNASGQIQAGDFYGVATKLKPDTVYYYCAVASNNAFNPTEIRYGSVKSFKTLPCATCDKTTITTKKPIVTGNTKATLQGTYSSTKTVKTYFEYKEHIIQAVSSSTSIGLGGVGPGVTTPGTVLPDWIKVDEKTHTPTAGYTTYGNMSYALSGLKSDTYYKVRAVGETNNPAETFYGDVLTFKTLKYNGVGPIPTIPGDGNGGSGTGGTGGTGGGSGGGNNGGGGTGGNGGGSGGSGGGSGGNNGGDDGNPGDDSSGGDGGGNNGGSGGNGNGTSGGSGGSGTGTSGGSGGSGTGTNGGTGGTGTGTSGGSGGTGTGNNGGNGGSGNGTNGGTSGTGTGTNGGSGGSSTDIDGDGTPNGQDSDIDGDGFPNNNDSDIDGDGIPNVIDSDTDGDGIPNSTDTDDDGDGIPDVVDGSPTGTGNPNDYDGGGIPNGSDSDMDGDGIPNVIDTDTDGDGIPNDQDTDDDNDGIPDVVDSTPTGPGTPNDYDGGGTPNDQDSDIDGDGFPNEQDSDTDGDGLPNNIDPDDDNDGIPDDTDTTPHGLDSNYGTVHNIGDIATPDIDDIVRYHEGIEHVFIRRIIKNVNLQKRYGYVPGSNLQLFAYDLAHTLAKQFGYVDGAGREIRVSKPDVSAYALRLSGNKLTVYEYYTNRIIDIRKSNAPFKNKNPYEYYFRK